MHRATTSSPSTTTTTFPAPQVWRNVLPHGCVVYVGDWTDLLMMLYIGCLPAFFLFVRIEYGRGKVRLILDTTSHLQGTFGPRDH